MMTTKGCPGLDGWRPDHTAPDAQSPPVHCGLSATAPIGFVPASSPYFIIKDIWSTAASTGYRLPYADSTCWYFGCCWKSLIDWFWYTRVYWSIQLTSMLTTMTFGQKTSSTPSRRCRSSRMKYTRMREGHYLNAYTTVFSFDILVAHSLQHCTPQKARAKEANRITYSSTKVQELVLTWWMSQENVARPEDLYEGPQSSWLGYLTLAERVNDIGDYADYIEQV